MGFRVNFDECMKSGQSKKMLDPKHNHCQLVQRVKVHERLEVCTLKVCILGFWVPNTLVQGSIP